MILTAPTEVVWREITDGLTSWFGADVSVERFAPGARVEFRWPDGTLRAALLEEVDPPRVLSFRWLAWARLVDGRAIAQPPTHVEMTLEETEGGTRLRVVESGFPTEQVIGA